MRGTKRSSGEKGQRYLAVRGKKEVCQLGEKKGSSGEERKRDLSLGREKGI